MCQSTTSSEREEGGDLNDTRLDPYQTVCVCGGRRDRLGHHPKQEMWLWWCVLLTLLSLTHATHLTHFLTNKTTLKLNETKRFDITLNSTYPLEQYVVTSEKQFILLLEIRSSQIRLEIRSSEIQLNPTLSSSQPALGQQLTVTLTFGDQHDAQLTWDNKTADLTPFLDPGKESELELTLINGTVAVNITHTVFQLTPSCFSSDHLLLV
ncbi:hypothetical protein Hamer_G012340, partial [Homarus americanus]